MTTPAPSSTTPAATPAPAATSSADSAREQAVAAYRRKFLEHRELETRVKKQRFDLRALVRDYDKTEDDLKAIQNVGQIIGEVLKQLDTDRFIVKASSGPRYVVGVRAKVNKASMVAGTRVALDMTTLTIMRTLPREVDPVVFNMLNESPGKISYSDIGGLNEQIRELREVIELPLTNPDLFKRVGIKPPKGVLLYGPPGTGKTLLARALANNIKASYLKVVASAIVDKYIGESARIIREMFGYAKDHQPCVIFMDEVDAIGGRRFSQGTSADREIQRTLMELLNQLDGFDDLGRVKMVMATNRPDTLDPALLRPGRLDRKIEIPIPSESNRLDILKIHAASISKHGEIDYESVVKLCEGFNGADLRNVCITGDHRVLTRTGWQSITAIKVGEQVLSLNIGKDRRGKYSWAMEWKAVIAVQCYEVDPSKVQHTLYRMEGSGMDVVATRDHSMLVARLGRSGVLQEETPIEYKSVGDLTGIKYVVKDTSLVTQFAHNQNRAVVCAGHNLQPDIKIVILGLEEVCDWWWAQDKQVGFLKFVGFWLGDGYLNTHWGNVCIGQEDVDSLAWLDELLDAVFPRWWYRSAHVAEKYSYVIRCPPLYNWLRVMAVGPLGYNPRDPTQLRSYPHFTVDAGLAAAERQSKYYVADNHRGIGSTWTQVEMLRAFNNIPSPASTTRSLRRTSTSASTSAPSEPSEPSEPADDEDVDMGVTTQVAGAFIRWWNNGLWIIINGHWFYLKRWLGDEQQVAAVWSQLSQKQATALLDGFCRADGKWASVQYSRGKPTGQWTCCNSSWPLLDHLSLIGQLAGAAVDLRLDYEAGTVKYIDGRAVTYSVDHFSLFFYFTESNKPFQSVPLAQPVDVSRNMEARGNYQYQDDGKVYDITVAGNSNFLTQRLAYKRLQTGRLGVKSHSVFVGNCTEAGMFAIRVERGYVMEEDFMKAARKIAETKKLEGKLEYEKV